MACIQCDVNLSQLIALLGNHLCQYPCSVSGVLVICHLPVPQAHTILSLHFELIGQFFFF